jgi:hypothetical protein
MKKDIKVERGNGDLRVSKVKDYIGVEKPKASSKKRIVVPPKRKK